MSRALDETSIAAQQPVEQLDRVQRVSDAWQTQVFEALLCYFCVMYDRLSTPKMTY